MSLIINNYLSSMNRNSVFTFDYHPINVTKITIAMKWATFFYKRGKHSFSEFIN